MAVNFYNQELAMHATVTKRAEPWGLVGLSKVLGVAPGLLRKWAERGAIPSTRDGTGRLQFDPATTGKWMLEREWR